MIDGQQSGPLETLERLYIEIHNGGHSLADRVRITLILARVLGVCMAAGSLNQDVLLRARNILSSELERLYTYPPSSERDDFCCQVLIELSKLYLLAPAAEPLVARSMLKDLLLSERFSEISPVLRLDLKRLLFHAQSVSNVLTEAPKIRIEDLRAEADGLGVVARGMVELSINRVEGFFDPQALEMAADVFVENKYLSAAFEAFFQLGTHELDRGHNLSARRFLDGAHKVSSQGGFLHGRMLSLFGLCQCEELVGNRKKVAGYVKQLKAIINTEVGLGAGALNLVAIEQASGDVDSALEIALKSRIFFEKVGLVALEAQALHAAGLLYIKKKNYDEAIATWERSREIEQRRHAFISAAERVGFIVQARMLGDLGAGEGLKPQTIVSILSDLQSADTSLASYGVHEQAMSLRARLAVLSSHVDMIKGERVSALRKLSLARELFERTAAEQDVAITHAFSAVAMLELARNGNPKLLEEALGSLQISLQFFAKEMHYGIRWKLFYFMAACSLMISQSKVSNEERYKWRNVAVAWLASADKELDKGEKHRPEPDESRVDPQIFAPGLKRKALDELKSALGISGTVKKRRAKQLEVKPAPNGGLLH
jgi:tetratricopeptide (TPR) repeat protein